MAEQDVPQIPLAIVKRLMKSKLQELQRPSAQGEKKDVNVQKELLQATAECTRVFIHYLVNAANDICQDNKRQNLSAEDVLKALEEAEFSEYQEPIRQMLERSREDAAVKAGKKSSKKRKAIEAELDNNNNVPAATADGENSNHGNQQQAEHVGDEQAAANEERAAGAKTALEEQDETKESEGSSGDSDDNNENDVKARDGGEHGEGGDNA